MSSIFNESPGASQSSEAEMAALIKAEPELANASRPPAEEPPAEPPAQATETPSTEAPASDGQQEAAPAESSQRPEKTVPMAALAEERAARRDLERQLAELRGQMQAWQQQMQPQGQQPGPQPEEPPDPDADPIGALRYERAERMKLMQFLQAQNTRNNVERAYMADARRVISGTPDWEAAYNHLKAQRIAQLQASGWQDGGQIKARIEQEEFGVVHDALRTGKSPAEQIYALAVAGGYVKPAAAPPPKPAAPDPALQEARAKAAAGIAEGGAAPKGELTLEDISQLHGAAQESALKKWEERNMKKRSIFRE